MQTSDFCLTAHERDISSHGVSWDAVFGGAFVATALSLLMLALGAGFELSTISPWSELSSSASNVGTVAIAWLIVTQVVASAMGGYLTGRLRTKWHAIHNDEVHFRDTANGFISWAVTIVVTTAFLASAAITMAGGSTSNSREASSNAEQSSHVAFFVDRLFRSVQPDGSDNDSAVRAEAGRMIANALRSKESMALDSGYLSQLVTARTGLNSADAAKRVSDTLTEARQAEDNLRKATARLLLSIFFALLIGAFCASYAATIGGKQRDRVQVI